MSAAHQKQGSALVEVLAALVLLAMAGAVVASAATTNLRSMRAGAVRGRLVAIAARELASLQVATITQGTHTEAFTEYDLVGHVTRRTIVDDDGELATLTVTVDASPPRTRINLTTRARVPW